MQWLNFVAALFFNQCIDQSYLIIELANYVIRVVKCFPIAMLNFVLHWRLIIFPTEKKSFLMNSKATSKISLQSHECQNGWWIFSWSYFRHTGTIIIHCNGHIGLVRNDIDVNEHEGLSNKVRISNCNKNLDIKCNAHDGFLE